MKKNEITNEVVYEILRTMHSYLKSIYYADNYKKFSKTKLDKVITKLDDTLYEAETIVSRF